MKRALFLLIIKIDTENKKAITTAARIIVVKPAGSNGALDTSEEEGDAKGSEELAVAEGIGELVEALGEALGVGDPEGVLD